MTSQLLGEENMAKIDFRKTILDEMDKQNLTMNALSVGCKMYPRTIQRFLIGERDITSERLAVILEFLGITINDSNHRAATVDCPF